MGAAPAAIAARAMQSASPILPAPGAQGKPSGFSLIPSRSGGCSDVDDGDGVLVGERPVRLCGEDVRQRLAVVVDDVVDAVLVEDLLPVRAQGLHVLVLVQQLVAHERRLAEDEDLAVLFRVEAISEGAAPAVLGVHMRTDSW